MIGHVGAALRQCRGRVVCTRNFFRGLTLFLALALALGATAQAQSTAQGLSLGTPVTAPPAPQPLRLQAPSYKFTSVVVKGNQRIERGTILSYATIARGKAISAAELNDAYQRVVASGLFAKVDFLPRGGRLLIVVQEYPTINQIGIEGNKRLKDAELRKLLGSRARHVFSPAQAEADAAAITKRYRFAGRFTATVVPKIIRLTENRVNLVFEVTEGRVVETERVSFIGNHAFSDWRLRGVLQSKQAGIFRALVKSDTFIAERIAYDKRSLRTFYLNRGYVNITVLSVTPEITRKRDAFFLTFHISEGQQFRFGKITATSKVKGADAAKFRAAIAARSGNIYSAKRVDYSLRRLEALSTEQGLRFIRITPRITRNDQALTVDVDFVIDKAPKVFVERIDIKGNSTTLDRVIRRQFHTVEGDPFDPRAIRNATRRIKALGYFADVQVTTSPGTNPDQVIVTVNVTEQPTGSLSFGLSYAVQSGAGVSIKFKEKNFLGRGQTLSFGVDTTRATRSFNFGFREPYFLDRNLAVGLAMNYTTSNNNQAAFDTKFVTVSPYVEFPVSENGRLHLRYSYSRNSLLNVTAASSQILRDEPTSASTSLLGYTYSYDTRRTGLNPNAGVLLQFGQDFAGLGGASRYIRTNALAKAETKVLREQVTLRAAIEGGAVTSLGGNVTRLTDRFFLTSDRMRGFKQTGTGPRDLIATNQDALGGNYFAAARFEAEFPLGLPAEYGITGGVFLDMGSVWGLDNINGGKTGTDPHDRVDDSFHLRSAIGVSVFWNTQIGPLRFNFSKAIKKMPYDREQRFDLTVSSQF